MRVLARLSVALPLGGCAGQASPSVAMFGAYFPYWLICMAAGVLGAVVIRLGFIQTGIDAILPLRLLVYVAIGAMIAAGLALTVYGR